MLTGADNFLFGFAAGIVLVHYVYKWYMHQAILRGKLVVMPDE